MKVEIGKERAPAREKICSPGAATLLFASAGSLDLAACAIGGAVGSES